MWAVQVFGEQSPGWKAQPMQRPRGRAMLSKTENQQGDHVAGVEWATERVQEVRVKRQMRAKSEGPQDFERPSSLTYRQMRPTEYLEQWLPVRYPK